MDHSLRARQPITSADYEDEIDEDQRASRRGTLLGYVLVVLVIALFLGAAVWIANGAPKFWE